MNVTSIPANPYGLNPTDSPRFSVTMQTATISERLRYCVIVVTRVVILLLLLAQSSTLQAAEQGISKNWRSIAIKGYDPVAYFTMNKAIEGKSRFEYRWHDARWRFISEEHLQLFASNPEHYAPRFGGYCAEGMALGRKASIDPHAWLIIEDKLYLNYSIKVRDAMAKHPEKTIEEADQIWESLQPLLQER